MSPVVYKRGLTESARYAATSGALEGPWVCGAFLNDLGGWGIVLRRSAPGVVVHLSSRSLHAELYAMDLADQWTPGVTLLTVDPAAADLVEKWTGGRWEPIPHYGHGQALLAFAKRACDPARLLSVEQATAHDPLVVGAQALAVFGTGIRPRQLRKAAVLDEAGRIAAAHPTERY